MGVVAFVRGEVGFHFEQMRREEALSYMRARGDCRHSLEIPHW